MSVTTTERAAPVRYMQGTAVPESSVRPGEFFRRTRRHTLSERASTAWAGPGGTEIVPIRKSDILSALRIKVDGTFTIALGGGTCASTARWPYDLIRQVRFTANGQSNIINVSGLKLRAREVMAKDHLNDRGVSNTIGGVARSQGTLSKASEGWGVGSNTTGLTSAAYNFSLEFRVPVAEDEVDLAGAIFAQTSSTDLDLVIDWETTANLFTLGGAATVTWNNVTYSVLSTKWSIPYVEGAIVVPDLSLFHSMTQSRYSGALATGDNEVRLVGQGPGKRLLRAFYQLWNGAAPQVPVAMNATNYGRQSYRYGSNETPDEYIDGQHLRYVNEDTYNADIGGLWGFGCHEFAAENAFRDTIDLGTTSEFRLVTNLAAGLALTAPALEVVQETAYVAGAGG